MYESYQPIHSDPDEARCDIRIMLIDDLEDVVQKVSDGSIDLEDADVEITRIGTRLANAIKSLNG